MPADILLYAAVAAGLVFWLRSVLGTRHGEERERHNPFTPQSEEAGGESAKTAVHASVAPSIDGNGMPVETNLQEGLGRGMAIDGDAAEAGLLQIAKTDRSFELAMFLNAAQDVFIMVVEGFSSGDRETLKMLLDEKVYHAFDKAIIQREQDGQEATVEIHAIRRTEVIDAVLEGSVAKVTVRFVADETNILRDDKGEILAGNPDYITETIDVWTFARDLKSKDPTWRVTETREEEASDAEDKEE